MISRGCGLARSRWVSHGSRTGEDRRGAKPLRFHAHCASLSPLCHSPWLARTAKCISSNSNSSNNNNNNNNNSTRIAITITITLALLAAQQAHGWAHSCADGKHGRVLPPRADLELVQRHGRVCRRFRRLLGKDIHASVRPLQTAAVGSRHPAHV